MKKTIAILIAMLLYVSADIADASTITTNHEENFMDVKESDWFYDDVKYVQENKLMTGTSEVEFSPSGETTRGMIVTILWRLEGEPVAEGKDFKDVSLDAWYSKAVAWASNNQIVSGYNEITFGPNDTATREQLATIMYRYALHKKYDVFDEAELDKYKDKEQISAYAVKSLKWANANGIISGTSKITISPKDNVLRSQIAAILKRFCENFKVLDINAENESNNDNDVTTKEEIKINDLNEKDKTTNSENSSGGNSNNLTNNSPGDSSANDLPDPEILYDPYEEIVENIELKTATIELKTSYGKAGDTIPVIVELKENPGILGAVLSLEYDVGAMTLIDVENGEAVEDVLTLTHSKEFASGMNFVWDGLELDSSDIKKGTMLVLYFELSSDAIPGKRYPLKLGYKPGNVIDDDLNKVNLTISQGFIEIEKQNNY